MVRDDIQLRPATPDAEEARVFAKHVDQAADGFLRFLFGKRHLDLLAQAYMHPAHDLSYENATFAIEGNEIVGLVTGYSSEQHRKSTQRPLTKARGFPRLRTILLGAWCWRMLSFLTRIDDGDFYVMALSTEASHQGKGIGSQLLLHLEDRATQHGAERLCLDVAHTNDGARRLYEHKGFFVVGQSPHLPFQRDAFLHRMVKQL